MCKCAGYFKPKCKHISKKEGDHSIPISQCQIAAQRCLKESFLLSPKSCKHLPSADTCGASYSFLPPFEIWLLCLGSSMAPLAGGFTKTLCVDRCMESLKFA